MKLWQKIELVFWMVKVVIVLYYTALTVASYTVLKTPSRHAVIYVNVYKQYKY